ncbi:hypothetical protein Ancab_012376 [Ancistrocladus abbreviatus]
MAMLMSSHGIHGRRMMTKPREGTAKTIKGVDGNVIDCVDIYKQPAFKHSLLQNHKMQRDNIRNQRENVVLTIANVQSRLVMPVDADPKIDEKAITEVFLKVLDNYIKWCKYLQKHVAWNSLEAINRERKLFLVSLYLLIWGEAANVRFLPECICYIFHGYAVVELIGQNGSISGAQGSLNVWKPLVARSRDFTATQIWVAAGSDDDTNASRMAYADSVFLRRRLCFPLVDFYFRKFMLDLSGGDGGDDDLFGIFSVKFSTDGREIVAAGSVDAIYIYDLVVNRPALKIHAHEADVNTVCFVDESGNVIYSGSDDSFCKFLVGLFELDFSSLFVT